MKQIDLTANKYGKLTVTSKAGTSLSGEQYWNCKCDCGNKKLILGKNLKRGVTKSCGCIVRKHSSSYTRLYKIWDGMKQRCYDQSNKGFKNYGAKGIQICTEWKEFTNFKQWAESNGYRETLTIERMDRTKGYTPDNCTWADYKTQARNRSNTTLSIDEVSIIKTLSKYGYSTAQIGLLLNVPRQTIGHVTHERSWSEIACLPI